MRKKFYTILRGETKSLAIITKNARLVALQPAGERPPFFMVDSYPHFIDVVKLIGTDQPVLSLIAQEDAQVLRSHTYSISDEAATHVESILERQPQGPYMLGGCSASGIVAYEVAQQLWARGHEVALLVLFDTPNPHFMREYSVLRMSLAYHRAALMRMRWREVPGWAAAKLSALAARKLKGPKRTLYGTGSRRLTAPQLGPSAARIAASRKYQPKPYRGRFLLFKRHRQLVGRYLDPQLGWGEAVGGKIEVCQLAATEHLEIFNSEQDRVFVAQKLRTSFDELAAAVPSHEIGATYISKRHLGRSSAPRRSTGLN